MSLHHIANLIKKILLAVKSFNLKKKTNNNKSLHNVT